MEIVSTLYHKLVNSSPYFEVALRTLYWNNVKVFRRFKISNHVDMPTQKVDFAKIVRLLKDKGVRQDDIMVLHTAYSPFKKSCTAESIIDSLLSVVPNGTIAMPAIRKYPEDEPYEDYIFQSFDGKVSVYDVNETKITSGYLPYVMTKRPEAHISRCPHNPLVAIGKDVENMMKGNIDMPFITAHGVGSCWDYCVKKDAWNIGLGIPIEGFLTIFHNLQECGDWPVKDWFFKRRFKVVDKDFQKEIIFNERVHKWTKRYAETNFNKDMLNEKIIKCYEVDGVPILMTKTSELFDFIKDKMKRNPAYPYVVAKKDLIKK